MRQRRFSRILIGLAVLWLPPDTAFAQQCQSNLSSAPIARMGYVCRGGGCGTDPDKVRIRVKINESGSIKTQIQNAIANWNSRKGATNTVFEIVSSGQDMTIGLAVPRTRAASGCPARGRFAIARAHCRRSSIRTPTTASLCLLTNWDTSLA